MSSNLRAGPRTLLPKGELDFPSSPADRTNKRSCISNACMPCRKRKSKCDGGIPSCAACANVYDTICYYDLDADRRRKGALKKDIRDLTATLKDARGILNLIKHGSEADMEELLHLIRQHPDDSEHTVLEEFHNPRYVDIPAGPPCIERALSVENDGRASKIEWGSVYYGHTSHFTLADNEKPMMIEQTVDEWTSVTNDLDLLNHLLSLYFTWSHPWYLLFAEEVFIHALRDKSSKYCSPLLVNAILALGCQFSDRPGARKDQNNPITVGDHFFEEAERLYHADREHTSLTMVQALGLMAIRQGMKNRDSSGRAYNAIMMSKVIELGLHNTFAAQPGGLLTGSEIQARKITFWGCFILENLSAICVGRVTTLPQLAIISGKPILVQQLESKVWQPHGMPNLTQEDFTNLQQASHKYGIQFQLSRLCEILDGILQMFYAPAARVTDTKLLQTWAKLQRWLEGLPAELYLSSRGATLPQIITLHIFYHNCVIHLFRPFLMVHFAQFRPSPRQICTDAANDISMLLEMYNKSYGLRRIFFINAHCIMTAAIIHVVNLASPKPGIRNNAHAKNHLVQAIRGLGQMTQGIPVAARYLKGIKSFSLKWFNVEHPIPEEVQNAMDEIPIETPSLINSTTASPPKPANGSLSNVGLQKTMSAAEMMPVMPMIPHFDQRTVQMPLQQPYWAPFSQASSNYQGQPTLPHHDANQVMAANTSKNSDLDHIIDEKLNEDGFVTNQDSFVMTQKGFVTNQDPPWSSEFKEFDEFGDLDMIGM